MSFRLATAAGTLVALGALGPMAAVAQSGGLYSYTVTPTYHVSSDLDAGGEVSVGGIMTTLGRTFPLSQRSSLGLRGHFDYENWDFDDLGAFGGVEPWSNFYRFGVSVPYSVAAGNGLIWNLAPTVGYAGESDARFSDAIEFGATLAVIRRLRPDLTLGLGLGAFRRIEDSYVFPVVIVNWQINDQLRLSNPNESGPAGPAGLELSYALGGGWDTGVGATFRDDRHRLDRNGPFADGVGEHRYTVAFARISRDISSTVRFGFYAGAEADPKLRVEDENGNRLFSEDGSSALLLGMNLVGRF